MEDLADNAKSLTDALFRSETIEVQTKVKMTIENLIKGALKSFSEIKNSSTTVRSSSLSSRSINSSCSQESMNEKIRKLFF